jgi:hyperosmotically inducible protein
MRGHRNHVTIAAFLAAILMIGSAGLAQNTSRNRKVDEALNREVHHELVMLPRFTVFDNLAYTVNGDEVTLTGQVTHDALKRDAGNAVKGIEGVRTVHNNIEVLPASPMDDGIRIAVFRAVYGETALQRYAQGAVPPIHIIVNMGRVTLEGVVANESDKNLANIRANGVPGVFSVTNNLRVEHAS